MTLVEVMLMVVVMALILSGVAWAVVPSVVSGRRSQTELDAWSIHSAVSLYLVQHEEECPHHVSDLDLSVSVRRLDGWGREFLILCKSGEEPVVLSPGPDGVVGTADDVRSAGE